MDDQRVDRADALRQRLHFVDVIHQRNLERRGDAGAAQAGCPGEHDEVLGVACIEPEVHRVQADRVESGVVHDRRQRVRDRLADHAEQRGIGSDAPEAEIAQQPPGGHLARRDTFPRIGPAVPKARGENPRRSTCGSHGDQDVTGRIIDSAGSARGKFEERKDV